MNSTMNFNQKTTKPLIMLCMTGFFVAGLQNKVLAEELVRTVEVSNEWKTGKQDEPVVLRLSDMSPSFRVRSATVWDGTKEIPSQLDDLDGDRKADELAFVLDVPAQSVKKLKVVLSSEKTDRTYPARVYAEMLVSDKNGKHVPISSLTIPGTSNVYNQLHHHGPAFESDQVAYRIYFDKKQTVDIYGKFNKGFEIRESQFYPTDEQLARGFGDDVLLVGNSCGVGALKGWDGKKATHIEPVASLTETIRAYGPVRTVTDIVSTDWQYQGSELQMTVRYILYAGHRDCEVQVHFAEPLKNEVFSTGVLNIKGSGVATCLPSDLIKNETQDAANYLYVIGAEGRSSFTYHITFTSMKETFGYKTKEDWFAFVQKWKKELHQSCQIEVK